ncbi:hypothetical protein Halru_2345 [Halovivax ruber XH-70]|uniref:DUF2795 domain-containing protein n=1 Tax=Halovivax ruber (strain DSM 18193 / JCM 13892 / XH-70) TaxID=797302 RepID=L0IBJ0_HALRX|nr:hypothetical protein [Halovivax ruber]AGB16930.1 hypothetical protein Halru_2345 [Halovivax ruber XH-70]
MAHEEPDVDRAQDRISERKAERAEATESILADVERRLGELEYPVTGEELSQEYALGEMDLPNETESLGSALDRLVNEEFSSADEAREAIYGEITGEAGNRDEANAGRDLERLDEQADRSITEGTDQR